MKKTFFIPLMAIISICLLSITASAQISLGLKGGLNVSNLNGLNDLEDVETKALVGFHFGAFTTFNLGRNFAIQPELVFSTQGTKVEDVDENLKVNYFNIPIMVRFLTNSGFYLEGGPQFGFKVNEISDVDFEDLDDEFENSEVSGCVGLGFQPTKSPFGIGARYNIGLTSVAELEDFDGSKVDVKNGVFQLSLYWRILGGGKLKDSNTHAKLPKVVL
jgi:hypothetical protein